MKSLFESIQANLRESTDGTKVYFAKTNATNEILIENNGKVAVMQLDDELNNIYRTKGIKGLKDWYKNNAFNLPQETSEELYDTSIITEYENEPTTKIELIYSSNINESEEYEDDEENRDFFELAEDYNGSSVSGELDDYEWTLVMENAPEIYKEALRCREAFVTSPEGFDWATIPDLVWEELDNLVDEKLLNDDYSTPRLLNR